MDIIAYFSFCVLALFTQPLLAAFNPADQPNDKYALCDVRQILFDNLKLEDGSHILHASISHVLRAAGLDPSSVDSIEPSAVSNMVDVVADPQWVASVTPRKELSPTYLRAIAIVRAAAVVARNTCHERDALPSSVLITPRTPIPSCKAAVDSMIDLCKRSVKNEISSCKEEERKAVADCKNFARAEVARCKDEVRDKVSDCKEKVRGAVAKCKIRVQEKIDGCKKDVQDEVATCKDNVRNKIADCKNHYNNEIKKCKKKLGFLCEVGRIFPPGACEPQRLGLPACELNRPKLEACEAQRPILIPACEPNRIKVPFCELGRPLSVLQEACELKRPQLLSGCELRRARSFECSTQKATACCEFPRAKAYARCLKNANVAGVRARVRSEERECQKKLFGKSDRKHDRKDLQEGRTDRVRCGLPSSLRPHHFYLFDNLYSPAEVDAALVKYEELIRGHVSDLVRCEAVEGNVIDD
ncbi:hypothetical protein BBP40_008700 [Aspergillus hancockii]|nr:hypothetical protein BBP40_008700 [Aspergillus hancockii]